MFMNIDGLFKFFLGKRILYSLYIRFGVMLNVIVIYCNVLYGFKVMLVMCNVINFIL